MIRSLDDCSERRKAASAWSQATATASPRTRSASGTRATARDHEALFDLDRRRGVLQPADRSAPSDRLLRGPPAGLQLQHPRQTRAGRPEHRPGSRRCSRAASIRRTIRPDEATAHQWPSRDTVRQFAAEADRRVRAALAAGDLDRPGDPLLHRAEAVFTILEHEAMHQETLLYMWHRLPLDQKRRPQAYQPVRGGRRSRARSGSRSRRPRHARRRRGRAAVRMGQRAATSCRRRRRRLRMQRHDVTNADLSRVRRTSGGPAPARSGSGTASIVVLARACSI